MSWRTRRSLRLVVDAAVLVVAFPTAVLLRFEFTLPQAALHLLVWWLPLTVGVALLTLIVADSHSYPWRFTELSELLLLAQTMAAAMVITLALWYAAPSVPLLRDPIVLQGLSRAVIVLHATFGFLGLCAVRLSRRLLHEHRRRRSRQRRGLRSRRVILLGAGRTGRTVARELVEHPELMLRPIGFVDDRPDLQAHFVSGLPVLGAVDDLSSVCERFQPDIALLTWDHGTERSRRGVRQSAEGLLPVRTVPALSNVLGGNIPDQDALEERDDGLPDQWLGPVEPEPPRIPAAKRALDLVAGSTLAAVATPVILVLAIGAAVQLRTWPFFLQDRVGMDQRHFRFPKIRTMPPEVSPYELLPDERQLPVYCRWLRRHHLDELPQLYLVPFGPMSLVGPRPKMPDDVEPTDEHYRTVRTLVPQGCTCLWQVGVHTDGLPSDAPEYDFWYLTHGSVRMDLWLLWRTALQILGMGRRHSLDDIPDWIKGPGWIDTELVFGADPPQQIRTATS